MMKNLKIGTKLIWGFLFVAIIAAAVGVIGVMSLKTADSSDTRLYEKMTAPLVDMGDMRNAFQRSRINLKDVLLSTTEVERKAAIEKIMTRRAEIEVSMKKVEITLLTDAGKVIFTDAKKGLSDYYVVADQVILLSQQGKNPEAKAVADGEGFKLAQNAETQLDELAIAKAKLAKEASEENTVKANRAIVIMISLSGAAFVLAMGIGIFLARLISKPIIFLVETADKLAQGDINVHAKANSKDEIGRLMTAFSNMIENTKDQAACAERVANGDLSIKYIEKSSEDIMGQKLNLMMDNVKALVGDTMSLSQAAVDGQLSTRADATKHQGDFRKIVEGVNGTLDAVIAPVQEASGVLVEMSKGNLKVSVHGDYKGDHAVIKNALNDTVGTLKGYVEEISSVLNEMADGNMVVGITADYRGDFSEIKEALNKIVNNLNSVLRDINDAADQVNGGARQVSDSSQNLSQGSTEQAASIEEITASLTQVAAQTRENAVSANRANELAVTSQKSAVVGNNQMKEMLEAMEQINESSSNINKIIKVIDEIAFQTNILALNAAVEAARAGQHGKGFAVVAEEVRNLAARSAGAAKETTAMIEGSIKKVEIGTKIANETAVALGSIVEGVSKAANLVGDIAVASNEQASAISQISTAIEQVSQVTQMNTATAEESAAASEELSSQSMLLKDMIGKFNLKKTDGFSGQTYLPKEPLQISQPRGKKAIKNISISL